MSGNISKILWKYFKAFGKVRIGWLGFTIGFIIGIIYEQGVPDFVKYAMVVPISFLVLFSLYEISSKER
jgi:hypothetical protein